MRYLIIIISFSILVACQTSEEKATKKAEKEEIVLDPAITEIVAFMADSVADCKTWLSKDYRPRKFFDASDTLADFLTEKFSHDDIVAFYESVESTSQLDLAPYLSELRLDGISEIDSLRGCVSSINAIAFLNNKQKAMVLFSTITKADVYTNNLLLEKPLRGWRITDTLR